MTELAGWTARERPGPETLHGRFVRLEPVRTHRHGPPLFEAHRAGDPEGALWAHLPYGPFLDWSSFRAHLLLQEASSDPLFFVAVDVGTGEARGVLALMRVVPEHGVIEVGHICHTPGFRRMPGTTEAIRLLGGLVFDRLGYRRFEWKCDAANAASRAAAERLGFEAEGVFRQHLVVKGRNRDTAWFSITDGEWPRVRAALDAWLAPDNHDRDGRQREGLAAIRAGLAG